MRAEATCPVTGTTITVNFTPDGVADVQPADAVVAAIHPGTVPEAAQLTDRRRVDAEVCVQQTFFANAEAAQSWLDRHPGGRIMPVIAFDQWLRHIITSAAAAAPSTGASSAGASTPPGSSGRCATIVCGHA